MPKNKVNIQQGSSNYISLELFEPMYDFSLPEASAKMALKEKIKVVNAPRGSTIFIDINASIYNVVCRFAEFLSCLIKQDSKIQKNEYRFIVRSIFECRFLN